MTKPVRIASSHLAWTLGGFAEAATEGEAPDLIPEPPPQDLTRLNGLCDSIRRSAERNGELPYLKYSLQYGLHMSPPELDRWANGGQIPWESDHLRQALLYFYNRIFPDEPLPSEPPNVEIVKTDGRGWDALRREQADRFPIPDHFWAYWREHNLL